MIQSLSFKVTMITTYVKNNIFMEELKAKYKEVKNKRTFVKVFLIILIS